MEEKLIEIVKKLQDIDPDKKYWIEVYHTWNEWSEGGIQWGVGITYGESQDNCEWRRNFFSDKSPMKALEKAYEYLYLQSIIK